MNIDTDAYLDRVAQEHMELTSDEWIDPDDVAYAIEQIKDLMYREHPDGGKWIRMDEVFSWCLVYINTPFTKISVKNHERFI